MDASWGRAVAQKVPRAVPEAPGIGFGSRFGSENVVFLMIFGVSAASFSRLLYGVDVCLFLYVFRLRAKTADMRNLQYLPHENVFFEVVLLRCRRGEGEEYGRKTHAKKASKIMKIL